MIVFITAGYSGKKFIFEKVRSLSLELFLPARMLNETGFLDLTEGTIALQTFPRRAFMHDASVVFWMQGAHETLSYGSSEP